jgi:hypothetical protein
MATCRPQNRSNRENKKKALGVLPKGILTPSFIEIAPAVTKRALLTDDDGCNVRHSLRTRLFFRRDSPQRAKKAVFQKFI